MTINQHEIPSSCFRILPESFAPSINEVIVGRGKKVASHCGNQRFKNIIQGMCQAYRSTANKTGKSAIIYRIMKQVRAGSPETGGFVKQDPQTERWYTVETAIARATIAQAFRDNFSNVYRSSKQSKQKKRLVCKLTSGSGDGRMQKAETPAFHLHPSSNSVVEPLGESSAELMPGSWLKQALDSAWDTLDKDMTFSNPMEAPMDPLLPLTFSGGEASQENEHDLALLLDNLERHAQVTENPFEPTPLGILSSVAPVREPYGLCGSHGQEGLKTWKNTHQGLSLQQALRRK